MDIRIANIFPKKRRGGRKGGRRRRKGWWQALQYYYYCYYYYYHYNGARFTALKVSRHCPLVLPVNVAWKEGKTFGSDESSALAVDFWAAQYQKGVEWARGLNFRVSRSALWRRLRFDEIFDVGGWPYEKRCCAERILGANSAFV